jgi:hypothetical protein
VLKVSTRAELRLALRRYRRYQLREQVNRHLLEKYRDMIVRFMETKNRKVVQDEEGDTWQKRQAVRIQYPEDAKDLRALLRKKGLDPAAVVSRETIITTVVDEEEILRLLKEKLITPQEYERVIIRQTYTPFITRLHGKDKGAGRKKVQIGKKSKPTGRGR